MKNNTWKKYDMKCGNFSTQIFKSIKCLTRQFFSGRPKKSIIITSIVKKNSQKHMLGARLFRFSETFIINLYLMKLDCWWNTQSSPRKLTHRCFFVLIFKHRAHFPTKLACKQKKFRMKKIIITLMCCDVVHRVPGIGLFT